ncbi:MAG: hypothetical protein EPN85_04705 [Bacteroidetes bacterium]|nr:MAG: hypothetical protein EPN85_04705 [Bacteroidota bacterium]
MNIKKELLREHSKRQANRIARYACRSNSNFKELIQCYSSHDYVLAQRAAWSVSIAGRMNPKLVAPHIKYLVDVISRKDVHNAVIRNSVRILEAINIPKKYQGKVMQACFGFLENYSVPGAIKAYSMTTLYNLSKKYPEIKGELKSIIEDRREQETPAFKSRGRKILFDLNQRE